MQPVFFCWTIKYSHCDYLHVSLSPRSVLSVTVTEQPTWKKKRISGAPFPLLVSRLLKVFLFPLFSPAVRRLPLASSPYPAEISLSMSTPGNSAGSPQGRRWRTRLSIICSGSGPITSTPWTSQTPQDWVGERGSSGVWEVSGPEPEPACHPVRQPNPSQACQPPLTQACRRPRLSQARHSRGNRRRPRLSQARHSRGISRRRLLLSQARRPRGNSRRRSRPKQARRQWVWQARRQLVWQAHLQLVWQARLQLVW